MKPEDTLQGRAYSIWEAEGRPEGKHLEHWLQAEREAAEMTTPAVDGPVLEPGEQHSAETGIENVIATDEETDPEVTGVATLVDSD